MRLFRARRFVWYLGVSAVLIAAVTIASGASVGRFFESNVLTHEHVHTGQQVRSLVDQHVTRYDFHLPFETEQHMRFQRMFADFTGVLRMRVFDGRRRVVWADEPRLVGVTFPEDPHVASALRGETVAILTEPEGDGRPDRAPRFVMRTYVPVTFGSGGRAIGVVEVHRDVTGHIAAIHGTQRFVWAVCAGIGALVYLTLALVVWHASTSERTAIGRLEHRNEELSVLQQFTESLLRPLDVSELPMTIVEGAATGLDLASATLLRIGRDGAATVRARWPFDDGVDGASDATADIVREAVAAGREIAREPVVAFPMAASRGVGHVFLAQFQRPLNGGAAGAMRALRIMLHEAAVALANADLFTEVREAHERLAAILAGVVDRMLIVDRDMQVVWMNSAAAEVHGSDPPTVGRACFDVFAAEGEACQGCPAVRAFESARVERGVRAQRFKSGQVRYLDLVAAPLRDGAGRVYQVLEVSRDITELVEMEERLKQSAARIEESHAELSVKARELERANVALRQAHAQLVEQERLAAVGQLVVGLHHAILNPLAGVLGTLQVLKQEQGLGVHAREGIRAAEVELWKVEELVRRLPRLRRTTDTPYVGATTMLDLDRALADDPPA